MNILHKSLRGIAIAAMLVSLLITIWQTLSPDARIYMGVVGFMVLFIALALSRYFWIRSTDSATQLFTIWLYALIGFCFAIFPNFIQWVIYASS